MNLLFLATVLSALILSPALVAVDPSNTLDLLRTDASKMAQSASGYDADVKASADDIVELSQAILDKWNASHRCSQAYLDTLNADATLLKSASSRRPQDRLKILELVRSDLKVKVRHANASSNAGDTVGPLVSVNFSSSHNGKKDGDFLVRCNPIGFGVNHEPPIIFNQRTSPTEPKPFAAGIYVCWLESARAKLGTTDFSIGDDDKTSISLTLEH